ncbi:hypothetical protein N7465_005976 [Penicillium sp. CMV-2018d]|nr:hypothetical protein N7465_005976 [Penicillium sp. CMV-2018d]
MGFLARSSQFVVQGFAKSELVCLVTATVGRVGRFDMGIKYPKAEFRGHWPLRLRLVLLVTRTAGSR